MKKFLLFVSFLFLTISNFCFASLSDKDSLQGKMSFGLNFTPGFSYRQLSVDTTVKYMQSYEYAREFLETSKMTFQLGLDFRYAISRFFSIRIGINYADSGYKIDSWTWYDANCIVNTGFVAINYHIRYLGIPCVIQFNSKYKKVQFYSAIGLSGDYLLQNSIAAKVDYDDYLNWENEKIIIDRSEEPICWYPPIWELRKSRFNLSGIFELGIKINLSNQISFSLAPKLNYSFYSIYNKPIIENIYGMGLNLGFIYSL